MRNTARLVVAFGVVFGVVGVPAAAEAGVISTENAKAGHPGGWPVSLDGTARGPGRCDVYPADWSITTGQTIRLKVRSTTSYAVRVFRIGWYQGYSARQVRLLTGFGSDTQPYPVADSTFGKAEARWHDSVSIPTDSSWTPGIYVARVEQPSGYQAETFFVLRDDGRTRMPLLLILPTATHQAYNAWPGASRGGKSLYGFNSSSSIPTESRSSFGAFNQAVKVSYDRPFLVGGGTADLGTWDFPMVRFLERNGWDVAYATDEDLHERPDLLRDRAAILWVGHSEYWSRPMFDHALERRNLGTPMMFATGNTIGFQIRYETGPAGSTSTVVGYKTSYRNDPLHEQGVALENAGRYDEAERSYGLVTRGWRSLVYHPEHGIDARRPGIILTGVMTAGAFNYWYPWAELRVRNSSLWIFSGTGLTYDSRIRGVMGYEFDTTKLGVSEYDKWRPASNHRRIGSIYDRNGDARGSAGYYVHSSGAEVVAFSAIAWSWALDSFASGTSSSVNAGAQRMVNNALRRWSGQQTLEAAQEASDGPPFVTDNLQALTSGDIALEESVDPGEGPDDPPPTQASGACSVANGASTDVLVLLGPLALLGLARRRARRSA